MIEILLNQGSKILFIDEIDIPLINHYKWYAHKECTKGYEQWYAYAPAVLANGRKSQVKLHRLITNALPNQFVDHWDHNGLNNTRENLRVCTPAQNAQNQRRNSINTSGFKGVSWHKQGNKWASYIKIEGKRKSLGLYHNIIEAAVAYDEVALKVFGKFAYLNFPGGNI